MVLPALGSQARRRKVSVGVLQVLVRNRVYHRKESAAEPQLPVWRLSVRDAALRDLVCHHKVQVEELQVQEDLQALAEEHLPQVQDAVCQVPHLSKVLRHKV